MTHYELVKLLENNGYDSGWAISDKTLILWEHEEEPPAPLTRFEVQND